MRYPKQVNNANKSFCCPITGSKNSSKEVIPTEESGRLTINLSFYREHKNQRFNSIENLISDEIIEENNEVFIVINWFFRGSHFENIIGEIVSYHNHINSGAINHDQILHYEGGLFLEGFNENLNGFYKIPIEQEFNIKKLRIQKD